VRNGVVRVVGFDAVAIPTEFLFKELLGEECVRRPDGNLMIDEDHVGGGVTINRSSVIPLVCLLSPSSGGKAAADRRLVVVVEITEPDIR